MGQNGVFSSPLYLRGVSGGPYPTNALSGWKVILFLETKVVDTSVWHRRSVTTQSEHSALHVFSMRLGLGD